MTTLENLLRSTGDDHSLHVEPGVVEIRRFGRAAPRLLIELPHGATSREEFEQLEARLETDSLPDDLISFYFANTDIGTPECAAEIASGFVKSLATEAGGAMVLRSLIPRTFIDCNRVVSSSDRDFLQAGVTQAIPDYIRDPHDLELLLSLHRSYQEKADLAYRAVCDQGALALALHSYAPRSVGIHRVDENIVRDLRAAYSPEVWPKWPERPEVDLLDRDIEGRRLGPKDLLEELFGRFTAAGIAAKMSSTYRLSPATTAYRHARQYPDQVLCIEFRRDLLADPFDAFEPMRISREKVQRMCRPLIRPLARFIESRDELATFRD